MIRNKNLILILTLLLVSFVTYDLYARGRGGGGGHRGGGGRNVSRSSPARGGSMHSSRGATRSSGQYNRGNQQRGSSGQYNRGTSNRRGDGVRDDRVGHRSGDININKNVNVNSNRRYYGGHGHRHYEHYNAGAFAAGLIVGTAISASAYSTAYPSGCVATFVGNTTYYQCGTTWYQREYASGGTTYIVVNNPAP